MPEFQAWFSPLLWTIGTLTTILGFIIMIVKFFRKGFRIIESISKGLNELQEKAKKWEDDLATLKNRAARSDDADRLIIKDKITRSYYECKGNNYIEPLTYNSLCSLHQLYHELNGNSYIDSIMDELKDLHQRSQERRDYISNLGTETKNKKDGDKSLPF